MRSWYFSSSVNSSFKRALVGWLCWGLTSQSTIFQSYRDGATASWVINQYFRGVKCLAQGHNTAAVGFEPPTSRSGVRHSTTEPPRSPSNGHAQPSSGTICLIFVQTFRLLPYFMCANIECSDLGLRCLQFCLFCLDALPYGPRQAKMCLRRFSTRYDSNQPAQLQKLTRILKFQI